MSDETNAIELEATNGDGSLEVPLGPNGELVRVLPSKRWKSRAIRAMKDGDIETWAELSLEGESYETWLDVDPDMGQIEDFFEAYSKLQGTDPNLSRASRRALTRTRQR